MIVRAGPIVLLGMLLVLSDSVGAQTRQAPLSVTDIEYLLEAGVSPQRVAQVIESQGVDFHTVTEEIRTRLKRAGADDAVIHVVERAASAAAQEQIGQQKPKPQELQRRLGKERKDDQPTGAPAQPQEEREDVAALLVLANNQERDTKLTTPPGDNALETYRKILQREPYHGAALAGVRRIRDRYVQWAEAAEKRGEWNNARINYEKALKVDAQDKELLSALQRVEGRKAEAAILSRPVQNHPPQIVQYFPAERTLSIQPGESRSFLATAEDPDNDALAYVWFVDDKQVMEGERFTFAASEVGRHRVSLAVTDPGGLSAETQWSIKVEPPVAELRLVMFTPHQSELSLFPHQSRFFGVQVEVPGVMEPSLRYEWKLNDQSVSTREVFEFREQPIGEYTIVAIVTASSGARLSQRWTVEVRHVDERTDIGPLWSPRVKVFDVADMVVDIHQPLLTVTGKVRNLDDSRSADNIVVWVSTLDKNGKTLSRRVALPTPQPLAPGQVGTFAVPLPNLAAIADFRIELLSKRAADEDHQHVKEQLIQRAKEAQQKKEWAEAEALIQTAMKVYPPDERILAGTLQQIREARGRQEPLVEQKQEGTVPGRE